MSKKRAATPVFQFRPHPWHGLEVGPEPPVQLNAFIEITPFDLMKYEVDKVSGYLHVDRPQRFSAQHPALYGFVPRTYCADRVRKLAPGSKRGDGDPLDICVLSERLQHYFLTYKLVPGQRAVARITKKYGRDHAVKVVNAAMADYASAFLG